METTNKTKKITKWLSQQVIKSNTVAFNINEFKGCKCYIGTDFVSAIGLNSISILIYNKEDNKHYFKTIFYFKPDIDVLLKDLKQINSICPIQSIGYDKWSATEFYIECNNEGYNMIPMKQTLESFDESTRLFYKLINDNQIILDDNELIRYCFSNTTIKTNWTNKIKPMRYNSNSITAIVSILTALDGYLKK